MRKNSKFFKSVVAGAMALSMMAAPQGMFGDAFSGLFNVTEVSAAAYTGRRYDQKGWSKSTTLDSQLQRAGCGIFAFANAIYNLNGKSVDVRTVATWAKGNNSWRPGNGGMYRDLFYTNKSVQNKYGSTYGFKIDKCAYGKVTNNEFINHLKNGGVAVAHVYNHFIAITDYSDSKGYYVVESYVTNGRALPSAGWVSGASLTTKNANSKVDWYCLISKSGVSNRFFPKYTGTSNSIVDGLKAVGCSDTSFTYRKKIAVANNISDYTGTPEQNTNMLNKLKAGNLIKP
jgi:hypothetical protein